jgi:hypothetical protein
MSNSMTSRKPSADAWCRAVACLESLKDLARGVCERIARTS